MAHNGAQHNVGNYLMFRGQTQVWGDIDSRPPTHRSTCKLLMDLPSDAPQ